MERSIAILGRQPAIGMAELESLYGEAVMPIGTYAAKLPLSAASVDFARLGGSIKLGNIIARVASANWPAVEKQLRSSAIDLAAAAPSGKLKLGLSAYGIDISVPKLNATGLTLKKAIRNIERDGSIRIVPNKDLELNSAQVLHNSLAASRDGNGIELLIIRDGSTAIIARTIAVQDIDAYAARDQGRPKRDARVGMLPPKLAQTIVNLAAAGRAPAADTTVLDPFCGTGVVLQESLLMGYSVYGTDLEPRMIDFTAANIEWLRTTHAKIAATPVQLEVGDATNHVWQPTPHIIAGEGYLGQPFSSLPAADKLAEVKTICNTILRKFLLNISSQIPAGSRLCLAVPAWQVRPGQFEHLPTLDHLADMGYNRVSFKHVSNADLVYARADQIVARELLVLIKN